MKTMLCKSDRGPCVVTVPDHCEEGDLLTVVGGAIIKQKGFNWEYPNEGEGQVYHYVAQQHFRGQSSHGDIRIEGGPDNRLYGMTLLDQIANQIEVPVVTVGQAKRLLSAHGDDYWKIEWTEGNIKAGSNDTGKIGVTPKENSPREWLNVEGSTKFPPNWPQTVIEWWEKWDEETRQELEDMGWTLERAKAIESGEEVWSDRPDEAPVGGTEDFPGVFIIVDQGEAEYGALKPWYAEVYLWSDQGILEGKYAFRMVTQKEANPPEEDERQGFYAIMMQPEDQLPYVVSDDVEKDWVPPEGWSAIPVRWRKNIPEKYRYWTEDTASERTTIRNKFVEEEDVRKVLRNTVQDKDQGKVTILKTDDEEQVVYGVLMRPYPYIDRQKEYARPEAVQHAAWKAMRNRAQISLSHRKSVSKWKAYLCESYIAPLDFELEGKQVKKGDWVIGVKIDDDEIWADTKAGKYTGFSIGGWADRLL